MRQHHMHRYWILAALTLAASVTAQVAAGQQIKFDAGYARNPPQVSRADFELLAKPVAAGNAILHVQFADQRRGTRIAIQGGPGPTYLRDDGTYPDVKIADGLYSAIVNVNTEGYLREQRRRLELAQRYPRLPNFHMRELIGDEPFRPLPLRPIHPGGRYDLDNFKGVPFDVTPWKELTITHTSVVEDPERTFDVCTGEGTPMGAWTFGKLMTEMANQKETKIRPGDFVEQWLEQWTTDLAINTFTVPNRQARAQLVIDNWPRLPDGQLDLAQAPFRLLAIVNRQDLRGNVMFGSGDAGEARVVFGMIDCNHVVRPGVEALPFLVIFEYGIRKNTCWDVKAWAQQWRELGTHWIGSPAYNAQLQSITDQFTLANANLSQLPNRSAINQVRTNEFALHPSGSETFWQLRESRLNTCKVLCGPDAGWLRHKTVAQTPDLSFILTVAGRTALRDFINTNEASILAGTHVVPLTLPGGQHFLGGAADVGAGVVWSPGSVDLEARHVFSLATCSACHTRETGTGFVHVSTRAAGEESQLSDFLTGQNMPKSDPVSLVDRTFHELLDRQQKLDAAASLSCLKAQDFALEEVFHEFVPPSFAH
jgi:hypothetical protein